MKPRQHQGCRPQITFTSDFHELVQGDLLSGPCVLRYDPLRLVEATTHRVSHQIRTHVRFHPGGSEWQDVLTLPPGLALADLADVAAQGLMLETTFQIPAGCEALEVWFACTDPDGHVHWDSDFGKNHWLRFGLHDLQFVVAKVTAAQTKTAAQDTLAFEFTTPATVDAVEVRWRLTSSPGQPRRSTPLASTALTAPGKTWTVPNGGIPVPKGATVVFDVVYRVGDRTFTDDNQGRWYLAD